MRGGRGAGKGGGRGGEWRGEEGRKVGVVRRLRGGREDGEKGEGQVTGGDWVLKTFIHTI